MARWRLTQKHYLNIPGSEWEYSETDRTSGRQARHRYVVPALLDPDSPNDRNREGDVVVPNLSSRRCESLDDIGPATSKKD